MAFKSVPVTILTGFLGAGKTSLLNHIIRENSNTKFAIIENEFGAINIDSDLVIATDENIFELSNGCICCSLNGDLFKVLNKLVTGTSAVGIKYKSSTPTWYICPSLSGNCPVPKPEASFTK